jgi:hypothetical protein
VKRSVRNIWCQKHGGHYSLHCTQCRKERDAAIVKAALRWYRKAYAVHTILPSEGNLARAVRARFPREAEPGLERFR